MTLGLPVDAVPSLDAVVQAMAACLSPRDGAGRASFLVTFVNPAAVPRADNHPAFREALRRFDLVLPDGIGMVLAMRALSRCQPVRISFDSTSLALPVFAAAAAQGHSLALIGGRPGVALRAQHAIARQFPALRFAGCWDGYGTTEQTIRAVRAAAPDIVVCGMGGMAQERFLIDLVAAGWQGAGFTCGGYLDQLADGLQYYPAWIDALNLRWAYRLWREPGRLWRRYLLDYGYFGHRFAVAQASRLLGRPQPGQAAPRGG